MKKIILAMSLLAPAYAGAQFNAGSSEERSSSATALPADSAEAADLAAKLQAILAAAEPAPAAKQEVQPSPKAKPGKFELMGKLDLYGGQYFFEDQSGAFNGYGILDVQLAKSKSSSAGYFISARSVYTGFKQVNELSGGGTLFQQSMDNSLGFKYIRRYEGGWSLKPKAGIKSQLFRETKDEKWGKGLYDFTRYEAGLTLEHKTRWGLSTPWTWQLSWDTYYTRYTRFKTLASQYGQELAAPNPGSRTLDTLTHQFSYTSEMDLPGFLRADFFAAMQMIGYQDQKVINSEGRYLPSDRSDYYQTVNAGLSKRYNDINVLGGVRPVLGMGLGAANMMSNQNHLDTDPARLKYIRGYYDYLEFRVTPSAQLTFIGTGMITRLSYGFASRGYSGRLAQRADGSYTARKLSQNSGSFTMDVVYPLFGSIDIKAQGNWASSSANSGYEQVYRYNYKSSMYFIGSEWRF